MARIQGPNTPDDDSTPVYRPDQGRENGSFRRGEKRSATNVDDDLDSRFAALDDDEDEGQQFRRAPKRVPVRRGTVTKKTAQRLKILLIVLIVLGSIAGIMLYLYDYGQHSWRFRIASGDDIEIAGIKHVTRAQVMQVVGGDIGRNVYFIPLEDRKKQLEQIPWVESAAVMRLLPNHLKVEITERKPVAFVALGSRVELIDANGVIMDLPVGTMANWSFPVIQGMTANEPLSTRAARMKLYRQLISELDSGGTNYSQDLNEVDLSDPEDVKVTVADATHAIVIHLGSSAPGTHSFLDRYTIFKTNVQKWRQEYPNLESVDLRYERQVILNPDSAGAATRAVHPENSSAAKPPHKR